ncbi:MAG: hypothetical protein M3063_13895 [Actinomycetota bacterium]|nr:hypothetical protein [Actinomycetota bacterium]
MSLLRLCQEISVGKGLHGLFETCQDPASARSPSAQGQQSLYNDNGSTQLAIDAFGYFSAAAPPHPT